MSSIIRETYKILYDLKPKNEPWKLRRTIFFDIVGRPDTSKKNHDVIAKSFTQQMKKSGSEVRIHKVTWDGQT